MVEWGAIFYRTDSTNKTVPDPLTLDKAQFVLKAMSTHTAGQFYSMINAIDNKKDNVMIRSYPTQREPETRLTDLYLAVIQTKLTEGHDVVLTVTGHSMRPLWRHRRDTITLTSCNPGQLRVGDIPLYRRENGQPVLHRIIKVDQNSFDLCGDNQIQVEYHLPKSNVIGVVQSFTRNGKTYSCNHRGYQVYSWLWLGLRPWRRWILGALNRLGIMT